MPDALQPGAAAAATRAVERSCQLPALPISGFRQHGPIRASLGSPRTALTGAEPTRWWASTECSAAEAGSRQP